MNRRNFVSPLIVMVAALAAGTLQAQSCNTAFCTLDMNSTIWINNNTWGSSSSPAGWSESITRQGNNSWRTDFNWPSGPNNNSVKAFPSTVFGWHWGWHFPSGSSGLPTQLSANRDINSSYSYSVSFGGGVGNVAYDIWLHTQSNPNLENPSDEIMIWVNSTGGAGPISQQPVISNINIGGSTWNLHRGNIGWNVWSFVRTSNSGSGSINVRNFTDYLRNNQGMSASKYVTSVQFGTEIFRGTGNLNVSNYTCSVSGGGGGGGSIADGTYRIRNRATGRYLDNLGSNVDGANVAQWSSSSSNNQRWAVTTTSGFRKIRVLSTSKYLDGMGRTSDGSNVGQYANGSSTNQQWTIQNVTGSFFRIVNRATNKAVDTGGLNSNGAVVQQWFVNESQNQQWEFVAP